MGFGPNILSMSLGARASKDMDLPHNISLILVKHLQSSVWLLLHINSSVTSDPSSSLLPRSYTCVPTNHITSPSLAYVHTYFHFLVSLVADSPIPIHIRLPMCDWAVRPFRLLPLLPDLSWNSILFQDYLVSSKAEHSALPAWVCSPICYPCTFVFWLKETDRNHHLRFGGQRAPLLQMCTFFLTNNHQYLPYCHRNKSS